jgi:outer membrane receptor protein involved in Fe transport
LPRNAGRGPGLFVFDLNVMREIKRLRLSVEFDNVLNKTVFSFGSEFIDASDFLVARRTMRPRQIRVGVKIDLGR